MSDEKRQKLKDIFDAALQQKPDERQQFVLEKCAGDETLKLEIESLLSSFDDSGSFMEETAISEVADVIIKENSLKRKRSFGHYEIIRQIGTGGMGEVYLARDKKLDRQVAIKTLNEKFSRHKSNLQRFIQEAKAASALNHPNILVIHEIGESKDAKFIVSEFIEGDTLRDVINKSPMKLSEVLEISIQISNALVAAHTARIVHRDIKPENIIVRPDGFVKILDFGLAKLVEQKPIGFEASTVKQNETAKGIILGTINYMSPEQAKGEKVDERTDIFSFGSLIYEMIVGKTPFAGDSTSETFANLINAEPQPLSRFAVNVPDELQRIVSKTLKKNKNERYQTIKDLLTDLKELRKNPIFEERSEKSSSNDVNATTILQLETGDVNNRTNETKNNFIEKFRQNKVLAAGLTILLLIAIGLGYYFLYSKKSVSITNGKITLAVLPFVNASQDANVEYLSDGITESVINNLSQISGLRVMSRNSAFRFKNKQTDTKNIASQLGVEILVTGDIKQLGDKLIINVRLINASDDTQIWGSQYIKISNDIIAAQKEIAQAVATNLRVKLTNSEQKQLGKNYTENIEAYQLYLKGRYYTVKSTLPDINKGIVHFKQAIDLDPHYALAYAGLAEAYRASVLAANRPPTEFLKAEEMAKKAVELDDTLSEAHRNLGAVMFFYNWDWKESENQYKRALELDPGNADAHWGYAILLSNTLRHTEALSEIKRARELDPLNLMINMAEGLCLDAAGKPDEALASLQKTLELNPNFWAAHFIISGVYIQKGMFAEAIAEARIAKEFNGDNAFLDANIAYALAKSGKTAEARAVLNEMLKSSTKHYIPPFSIAVAYNGLDERDETLNWLKRGVDARDVDSVFLKVNSKWNNLRNEPRFIELMQRIGFEK